MTIDEMLSKMPMVVDNGHGEVGYFTLKYESKSDWRAGYELNEELWLCMNPDSENPPFDNAVMLGSDPNNAIEQLYDLCLEHKLNKESADGWHIAFSSDLMSLRERKIAQIRQ